MKGLRDAKASAMGPPVIDLSNFEQRKGDIRQQLMDAATVTGFFYITGHGIPEELISSAWKTSEKFFQQPEAAKQALPKVDWAKAEVIGFERNNLTDGTIHESMMTSYEVHDRMKAAWPSEKMVPGFRKTTLEFMTSMQPVVQQILSCFAEALGFPSDFFNETIDVSTTDNRSFLQYHKYPSLEGIKWKPGTNRITAHTDESLITLLYTSPSSVGLELAAGSDGAAVEGVSDGLHKVENWTQCPPLPGCITVNIGDPLQLWSDGLLKSNFHRVRMPYPHEPQ
ncbi:hypothetical protein WJX84_007124, partial [Apatococcus fuscideae]